MKICAYVQEAYAKQTYKNECMDTRQFVGLRVVIDALEKCGYTVEYAGIATVHEYDIVLVSITAFCDWWSFLAERIRWKKGRYKVFVGGAGVLHVTPFLPWVDAFMIGRGEDTIGPLVKAAEKGDRFEDDSVVYSDDFSEEKIYHIKQATGSYPNPIQLHKGTPWVEGQIGCNHRCLFCSYTWSRKQNFSGAFKWDGGGTIDMSQKECALLDYKSGEYKVNWKMIRTTAIDGSSQRLRYGVGKKIHDDVIVDFIRDAVASEASPHIVRLFNIVGYPTETIEDYAALVEVFKRADEACAETRNGKKWVFGLQNNHFIPYPATPMACAPFSCKDYRNSMISGLKSTLPKRRLYSGRCVDLVEGQLEEGLSTVLLNVIVARAGREDWESIEKIALSKKFWNSNDAVKCATLEKYFDLNVLCGAYTPDSLPSRYLRTYAKVEKMWGETPLEREYRVQCGL